jgi:hypothetical protein
MAWDICPGEYKARYVDERPFELTEAVAFGQSVHMGLEAHYAGQDAERAFRAAWKTYSDQLGRVHRGLTSTGLELLDKTIALDLHGIPERGFSIDTETVLGAPIIGAVDLWGDGVIYDFKTTRGLWSQERADAELWQPLLYAWAYWQECGTFPDFEYIVLNRVTGALDRFRRAWSEESWAERFGEAYDRMRAIQGAVAARKFDCPKLHGFCPECGDRWTHYHTCDEATSRPIRL